MKSLGFMGAAMAALTHGLGKISIAMPEFTFTNQRAIGRKQFIQRGAKVRCPSNAGPAMKAFCAKVNAGADRIPQLETRMRSKKVDRWGRPEFPPVPCKYSMGIPNKGLRSKYAPHQGGKEMARRVAQMEKTA